MRRNRDPSELAPRLAALPRCRALGRDVAVAATYHSRLLGLAGLPRRRAGTGLLLPGCRSVHTFGMRFELDLVFLDAEGRALAIFTRVPPRRLVWRRDAAAVLELPSFPPTRR